MFHADNAYFLAEFRINSRRVKTNTVSNTAFRGFGGPQGMLAIERVIDAIAWNLRLDPLDVRKANLYGAGRDVTPYGQTVEDHDVALRLIEQLERSSNYRVRRNEIKEFNARSPILKRGIALTPVKFGISFTLSTSIKPARWSTSIRTALFTSIMAARKWARACFRKWRRWPRKTSA